MSNEHHVARGIHHLLKDIPPIREKKNPFVVTHLKVFSGFAAAFFLMQIPPLWAQEPRKLVSPFGPEAIWNPQDEFKIRDRCSKPTSQWTGCIVSEMRAEGASGDAIRVVELLKGEAYLIEFREFGQVDLAAVSNFSYNSPELAHREILVNGAPTIVDPMEVIFRKGIDIRKDPLYPTLARKFPNAKLGTFYDFQAVQQLPNGGQRFIFRTFA